MGQSSSTPTQLVQANAVCDIRNVRETIDMKNVMTTGGLSFHRLIAFSSIIVEDQFDFIGGPGTLDI
jgi:hypothetical protein